MKNLIKNSLFTFILGSLIFGSLTMVSAYNYIANNISFKPTDTNWKNEDGTDITNTEQAINSLYKRIQNKNISLYVSGNDVSTASTSNRTITKTLPKGKYIIILNAFSAVSLDDGNEYVDIQLSNPNNSYKIIKTITQGVRFEYYTNVEYKTYLLTINEEEEINFFSREPITASDRTAGLIYQIYKIN